VEIPEFVYDHDENPFPFTANLKPYQSHFSSLTTIASNFDNVPHYTSDSNSYDSDFRDDFDTVPFFFSNF
jgi:hypothetical protein